MNRIQKTSRRPPMNYLDKDLLNSMIYNLKRSVHLRWLLDLVLHSSLDDLVFQTVPKAQRSKVLVLSPTKLLFSHVTNWAKFSSQILTKGHPQSLDQASASEPWPNFSFKVFAKIQLQNLDQKWVSCCKGRQWMIGLGVQIRLMYKFNEIKAEAHTNILCLLWPWNYLTLDLVWQLSLSHFVYKLPSFLTIVFQSQFQFSGSV